MSAPAYKQTESDFQDAVVSYAHLRGFLVAHFRPAKTSTGWRTAVSADGAGFPDCVFSGHGRTFFRELKAEGGKLSDQQRLWLGVLERNGADVGVWRPSDWPEIERELAS